MKSTNHIGIIAQDMFKIVPETPVNPTIGVSASPENNITLNRGMTEMLKITEDGFYVRGKKVEADEDEAAAVYRAFKRWLVESALTK